MVLKQNNAKKVIFKKLKQREKKIAQAILNKKTNKQTKTLACQGEGSSMAAFLTHYIFRKGFCFLFIILNEISGR